MMTGIRPRQAHVAEQIWRDSTGQCGKNLLLEGARQVAETHDALGQCPAHARTWIGQSRTAADHVEVSIIDTRLRAVESLLREQTAER